MQTTLTLENKKSPLGRRNIEDPASNEQREDLGAEKTRITIIEDNQVIRDNVARFIRFHEEFDVVETVGSIESFMHLLQIDHRFKTDIILLDIGLPGVSGLDGIPMILEKMPEVDIIMLTSYEEEDVILRALCSGACSYLSKKASLEEIVDAIRIVVKGGSYMSPSIAREIVTHLMGGRVSKATILTERQKEILEKLVEGKSYGAIAQSLFISIETVRTHVKSMYKVLHVNNKAEAIAKYLKGEIK